MHLIWLHLLELTGILNSQSEASNFWCGFGADLGELTIVGALIAFYKKNTCEVHTCWRLGRHMTAAGHHVCRKHHPDDRLTAEAVISAHKEAS